MTDYKRNHYVPQWYQYRFLGGEEREKKFFYLDLKPDTVTTSLGKRYTRKALFRWGPRSCFYQDDLYTARFKEWDFREIEQSFFGKIDGNGENAIEYFSKFKHPSADKEAFYALILYMSVQKLRTLKGLSYLASITKYADKNQILSTMLGLRRIYCALWVECIWCIVDASETKTQFILSDHPVTVYNQECFPDSKWCTDANDPPIWLNGTHTIFPLSSDKALILTNLSWIRNPYANPLEERPHPEMLRDAIFDFTAIQTGRRLSEEEVIAINYIIKRRAYRYIAAAKEEWLYPEKSFIYKRWRKIGKSYVLMPDPRSVDFSGNIVLGYKNKTVEIFDEYGRKPWHPDYEDKQRHNEEWESFHRFQGEYARLFGPKRRGITFELDRKNKSEDSEDFHAYHLSLEHIHKAKKSTKNRLE